MAHDKELNNRIRKVLQNTKGCSEKNMFGGLIFTHNGNMLCGADLKNGLMVRVGPEQFIKTMARKYAKPMDITGRPMKGFVFVEREGYKTDKQLEKWIQLGLNFTNTLPKK